jgi:hypothetical protein
VCGHIDSILVKSDIFGKKASAIGLNVPIFQLNSPNTVSNKVPIMLSNSTN